MEGRVVERSLLAWFGPIVGRVGGLLARRGPLTLPALVQLSSGEITGRQAREALFVLLSHSLCTWASLGVSAASEREQIEYRLDARRVKVVLVGFPWLSYFVLSEYGKEAADYVTEIAVMGMLPRSSGGALALEARLLDAGLIEPITSLGSGPPRRRAIPACPPPGSDSERPWAGAATRTFSD